MTNLPYSPGLFQHALRYAAYGWHVIPVRPRGKAPLTPHGVKDATADPDTLRAWWAEYPEANIGVALGSASGIVVLDVDDLNALRDLIEQHGPLPDTAVAITGRGRHYFFKCPPGGVRTRRIAPGVELRADGSYVVVPPSVHPTGKRYEWELAPDEVKLAPLPAWALAERGSHHHTGVGELPAEIYEGERNTTLFLHAASLRGRGMQEEEILAELREINALRCRPPLDDDEVVRIARSVCRYPAGEGERRSQADRLIAYALTSGARLVIDQYGQAHVVVDSVPYALPRGAYPWLRRLLWKHERRGATAEALQTAAGALEAQALDKKERVELHVRTAWCEGTLFVWLGPQRTLAIDAHGWRVVSSAPILFRHYPTLQELPDPADGTKVGELADCLDLVAPAEPVLRRLTTAWVALAWFPHIARPILAFTGDWGAGKTLRQRLIKRLLDPSKPESIRLDPRELVQKLAHCQIALLDNLGSLPDWGIDALCRAVTGEGDAKRRLYTDEEDVVFEFRRAIMLNAINMPADRPDFADRLLPVELERISDAHRQEEAAIWARFTERHGVWLGALATLLSHALRIYPTLRPERLPRLADWGRWAMAVYEALGWGAAQFAADWATIVEKQHAAAIEGSPVAQALLYWMSSRSHWRGTSSQLLEELVPTAEKLQLTRTPQWPKTPVWLSRRLREVRPVLAARGIVAREEREGRERTRIWVLQRLPDPGGPDNDTHSEDVPEIPSVPSVASATASGSAFSADSNADSKRAHRAIPSAIPSAQNPHGDGHADGTDAADSISGTSSGYGVVVCSVCRQPYEVRPSERAGWVQIRCQCTRGWDWCRADDPALRRSS